MRRFLSMTMVATTVAMLAACGEPQSATGDVSQVHFITFGPNVSGLVSQVKKPRMRACLFGVSESERAKWAKNIETSVLKWVAPLRALTSAPLTAGVDVVSSRVDCDTEIQVTPGTHSNTSIGQRPVVRMSPTGYFAGFNVLLHEFGHAFALSDTYQGGQSGNCQPGQPQALMCNTSFSDPQADDIKGVTQVFKRVFPNDRPGATPPESNIYKLYAALGVSSGQDRYRLHAAVQGASATARGAVAYCLGTRATCTAAGGLWRDFTPSGRHGDVAIYSLGSELLLRDGMTMMLRYQDEAGMTYQALRLDQEA